VVIKKLARKVRKKSSTGKKTPKSKSLLKNISDAELHSLIEKKAYELFIERGYANGDDQGDWYKAEKLVIRSLKI
jgi:hypothetical protein